MSETQNTIEATTKPEVINAEQQLAELKKATEIQHRQYTNLARAFLADLLNDLAFKKGLDGNQKVAYINAILDAQDGALDAGVDITKIKMPSKSAVGKRAEKYGQCIAAVVENKFLIIAQKMQEAEQKANLTTKETENNDVQQNS